MSCYGDLITTIIIYMILELREQRQINLCNRYNTGADPGFRLGGGAHCSGGGAQLRKGVTER